MLERLDFGALWPVPPGRFGWTARGNEPCVMEIVSWLTTGAIDTAWPGVSPAIAEYVQAAQDALDDQARQKLLVLVPGSLAAQEKTIRPRLNLRGALYWLNDRSRFWCSWPCKREVGPSRPKRFAFGPAHLSTFEVPSARPPNT